MMLKLITGKKYSERTEIRIAALSSSLQAALRTGDPNLIGQAADQILALRPEQLSAVTAKAYSLEIAGDIAGLEKFFNDRIKRFPQVQENYFMLLEASLRLHPLAATAPQTAKSFIQNFPNEFESISAIAWTLLNNAPFDAAALAVVSDACAILQKAPAASVSGKILTTRALFAYRSCKLQEALNLLRQAYERTGNAQEKAFVKNMLEYLKAVEKSTR